MEGSTSLPVWQSFRGDLFRSSVRNVEKTICGTLQDKVADHSFEGIVAEREQTFRCCWRHSFFSFQLFGLVDLFVFVIVIVFRRGPVNRLQNSPRLKAAAYHIVGGGKKFSPFIEDSSLSIPPIDWRFHAAIILYIDSRHTISTAYLVNVRLRINIHTSLDALARLLDFLIHICGQAVEPVSAPRFSMFQKWAWTALTTFEQKSEIPCSHSSG